MDGKTFLLTLVFGHDGVGNLLRHAGNGSHRGHCRSRGRIAWLLQKDKEDPDPPARE